MSEAAESQPPGPPNAQPQAEHRWLQRLVGEWTYESEASMGPDQPPVKASGVERVRSIGGLWIVAEGEGAMPGGGPATTVITLGYDPAKGRFVGSFIASMMDQFWVYEGSLEGDVLSLDTEGPAFSGEGRSPYRDQVELIGDDERVLRSLAPDGNGGWTEFMTARYRRTQ